MDNLDKYFYNDIKVLIIEYTKKNSKEVHQDILSCVLADISNIDRIDFHSWARTRTGYPLFTLPYGFFIPRYIKKKDTV